MTGHTYLLKSRHGVYYLRVVLPERKARLFGRRAGELRFSLRTKSKEQAKLRLAEKLHAMIKDTDLMPWEAEADKQRASYERGLALVEQFGRVLPRDVHRIDAIHETLSPQEFEDFIYVHEYEAQLHNPLPQRPQAPSPVEVRQPEKDAPNQPTNDELIDRALKRFVESKKAHARGAAATKYGAQCALFEKIVSGGRTGMRLSEVTVERLRHYVDVLPKLPKKIMPNDPLPESGLLGTEAASTMSPKTIFSHAQAVNMFLTWCGEQAYPVTKQFEGILKPLLKKPKGRRLEKHFKSDELKLIFGSEHYKEGNFKRPSDYWLPLLALFTGAREAELCQLYHDDIYRDLGSELLVISFNERDGKRLKADASARIVPVHRTLIALGFEDYLKMARTRDATRIFAEETRNDRGEFSAFSKRFNRYRESLGIKTIANETKKDFHSFRHTLSSHLLAEGAEEHVVNSIVGHSQAARSESVKTYSKGVSLEAKYALLLTVNWEIDFTQIKPNGWEPHPPGF